MKNPFTLLLLIIFLGSCARQKQIWFNELHSAHQADQSYVSRVYIDKKGSLYPSSKIYIPYKYFFDPCDKGNTTFI